MSSNHQEQRQRIYLPGARARQEQFARQQQRQQQQMLQQQQQQQQQQQRQHHHQQQQRARSKFADARRASKAQTNQALNHLLSSTLIKQICPCCGCEIIANSQAELDKMMREHNA